MLYMQNMMQFNFISTDKNKMLSCNLFSLESYSCRNVAGVVH